MMNMSKNARKKCVDHLGNFFNSVTEKRSVFKYENLIKYAETVVNPNE